MSSPLVSPLPAGLQALVPPAIARHSGKRSGALDEHAFEPNPDGSKGWRFQTADEQESAGLFASDCRRFALAALESVTAAEQAFRVPESVPWGLVKQYYAGFYAAHAMMRALGYACMHFEGKRRRAIAETIRAHHPSMNFPAGTYSVQLGANRKTLLVQPAPSSSGHHEVFWGMFVDWVKDTENALLGSQLNLDPLVAQSAAVALREFRTKLAPPAWLSVVRNAIQYRQEHDVWWPDRLTKKELGSMCREAASWRRPPALGGTSEQEDLVKLVSLTSFLVALCRELMEAVATLGDSKGFAKQGPVRFMRHMKAVA